MKNELFSPDDPRLTAYALGELDHLERPAVEAALAANPALRATVDEIRAMSGHLAHALSAEAVPAAAAPAPVIAFPSATYAAGGVVRKLNGAGRAPVLTFPRLYYIVGGMAAACFAVMVAVTERPLPETRQEEARRYMKVELQAGPPAAAPEATEAPVARAREAGTIISIPAPDSAAAIRASAPVGADLRAEGRAPQSSESDVGAAAQPVAGTNTPEQPAPLQRADSATRIPPFEVTAQQDNSFMTSSVGTGSRLNLELKDSPAAYSVINREFIDALGITDVSEAATWAPGQTFSVAPGGAVAGGQGVNAPAAAGRGGRAGGAGGAGGRGGAVLQKSAAVQSNVAPASEANARNFYMSGSVTNENRYAVESFDFGRGPNATLFGETVFRGPNTESYGFRRDNRFTGVADQPLSTFSIDVDTASYANVRRFIENRQRPPRDAVRVEEMINYFPYSYAAPRDDLPFATTLEVAGSPWNPEQRLVRIGIKGREVSTERRERANLVFLLDVSGSMQPANRLPLVKESLRLLLRRLREDDRVAIVVYAGGTGVALPSTAVSNSQTILNAIESLAASGSTNGAAGIQLAYDIAQQNFVRGGVNRVILCTDGDFNVGVTNQGDLVRMIEEKAKSNVFLTVLGFGMGNLKDSTLELLADKGNGNYGYIDSRREAEKLLVDQVSSTLVTIAKDVKIQVEFNPAKVAAYRLVGYENRLLAREDFNNDAVDAGEIGAGHTVTALYEIIPAGSGDAPSVDPLRYQQTSGSPQSAIGNPQSRGNPQSEELLTVKIRYKEPTGDRSRLQEFPLIDRGPGFQSASLDFRFAAAVATFGMELRNDVVRPSILQDVAGWAAASIGADPGGYRADFINLVRQAAQGLAR